MGTRLPASSAAIAFYLSAAREDFHINDQTQFGKAVGKIGRNPPAPATVECMDDELCRPPSKSLIKQHGDWQ